MGVEFRLGGQDHNKVEDFLAQRPSGIHAITLDTKAAKHQQAAAEAEPTLRSRCYSSPPPSV